MELKKIIMQVARVSALISAIVTILVSCSDKPEDTIANLKTAITGELTTNATYLAFAVKATEEGHRYIANMFLATAAAEEIHARNHNDVLKKLGEREYKPTVVALTVMGTLENIQSAVDGETHEYTVTYPGLIATAKKEKCEDAVTSFTLANLAEENHAKQYAEALKSLKDEGNDKKVSSRWFVCAQCGGMFKETFAKCSLCRADAERQYFIPRVFDADH